MKRKQRYDDFFSSFIQILNNKRHLPREVTLDNRTQTLAPKFCLGRVIAEDGRGSVRKNLERDKHYYAGIFFCKSVHACPICAPIIRSRKSKEVQQVLDAHCAAGGSWAFLTFTAPHSRADDPMELLNRMKLAEGGFWRSRAVKKIMKGIGFIESIKVWEFTFSKAYGFHPHSHQLAAIDSGVDLVELEEALFPHWRNYCLKRGLREPSRTAFKIENGSKAGAYITKIDCLDNSGLSNELTRGDRKAGKDGHLQPFELLNLVCAHGPKHWALKYWIDYVCMTKGKHFISRYPKLKALYPVEETDESDFMNHPETESVLRATFGEDLWSIINHKELFEPVLDKFDAGMDPAHIFDWVRKFEVCSTQLACR